jgi:hypothetical protein
MFSHRSSKAVANENNYPYVVEIAVDTNGLDVELSRQIMVFHKSREIRPRHGRTIARQGRFYYRWCFSDLTDARAFLEQFSGEFCKSAN